jgi:ribonuclease HI
MNHYAEASAALHTLRLARDTGVKHLWLEGDSKNIIDCLIKKTKPAWTIDNLIGECIHILRSFDHVYVAHEFREANQVADRLANMVVVSGGMKSWVNGNMPLEIQLLLESDRIPGRIGNIKRHS